MHVGNILLNMVSRVKHIPSDPDDEVPWIDGSKQWIVGGKLHRLDGPAYINNNGSKAWWVNGKLHRSDGPAIEYAHGTLEWYAHGHLHRLDGPAYIGNDGSKAWWANGKLHRIDGPAYIGDSGLKAWYFNGICITNEAIEWMKEQKVTYPFDEPTQMLFMMKFG